MICKPCRERNHEECPGGTWCDCAHVPGTPLHQPEPQASLTGPDAETERGRRLPFDKR